MSCSSCFYRANRFQGLEHLNCVELLVPRHEPRWTSAVITITFWRQQVLDEVPETKPTPRIVLEINTHENSPSWVDVVSEIFHYLAPCTFLCLSIRFHPVQCLTCRDYLIDPLQANKDAIELFQLPVFGKAPLCLHRDRSQTWLARRVSLA